MDGSLCEMLWALSLTPTWLLSLSTVLHDQQCKSGIFKPKATGKELQRLRQFLQHLWQKSARPIPLLLPFLQGPLLSLLISPRYQRYHYCSIIHNAFPPFFVHIIYIYIYTFSFLALFSFIYLYCFSHRSTIWSELRVLSLVTSSSATTCRYQNVGSTMVWWPLTRFWNRPVRPEPRQAPEGMVG